MECNPFLQGLGVVFAVLVVIASGLCTGWSVKKLVNRRRKKK